MVLTKAEEGVWFGSDGAFDEASGLQAGFMSSLLCVQSQLSADLSPYEIVFCKCSRCWKCTMGAEKRKLLTRGPETA